MPNFDIKNNNKVHLSVIRKLVHVRLKMKLANVTSEQLAQMASDINRKNVERNKKGEACEYFGPKKTPKGFVMSYPRPLGKFTYDNVAWACQDETVIWKLLRAAVKARDAAAKVPEATPQTLKPAEEIATVNVILLESGQVKSMKSWVESPEGNAAAEACFRADAIRLGCHLEDLDAAVEDGFLDAAPEDLVLVHSC